MENLLRGLLALAFSLLVLALFALFFVQSLASRIADLLAIAIVLLFILLVILVLRRKMYLESVEGSTSITS